MVHQRSRTDRERTQVNIFFGKRTAGESKLSGLPLYLSSKDVLSLETCLSLSSCSICVCVCMSRYMCVCTWSVCTWRRTHMEASFPFPRNHLSMSRPPLLPCVFVPMCLSMSKETEMQAGCIWTSRWRESRVHGLRHSQERVSSASSGVGRDSPHYMRACAPFTTHTTPLVLRSSAGAGREAERLICGWFQCCGSCLAAPLRNV